MTINVFRYSILVCCGLLLGCGSNPEPPEFSQKLVPVMGKVTWKGDPLAGATVRFFPPDPGKGGLEPAEATTDEGGNYTLYTMMGSGASQEDRTGALPGEYKVLISKIVRPDGSPLPPDMTEADALAEGAKQLLPPKYSDGERTTLRETVKPDASAINFELTP